MENIEYHYYNIYAHQGILFVNINFFLIEKMEAVCDLIIFFAITKFRLTKIIYLLLFVYANIIATLFIRIGFNEIVC